ncbi:putative malate dehydrogenase [Golovinomyces cichoracearum]|uniref:Putative malate dehydrogenase n=1 Tax=Golovinomyces cichoracearum TaxID=62708 RepID=A0A420I7S3_9PEZI|nr:putative malate dehydrogenase [Golovinomyces cichoracearum]
MIMLSALFLAIFILNFQLSLSTPFRAISHKNILDTRSARNSWRDTRVASECDLTNAHVTADASSPLPPPSEEFVAKHIAIGRGTQNYTCTKNPTDPPISIGALALLYDASCIASEDPTTLSQLPNAALKLQLPTDETRGFTSSNLTVSGHHFFPDPKTPVFDLRTAATDLGSVIPKKNCSAPAPPDSIAGQNNKGDGAVLWLKLVASSGKLREVYRVNTAGGNPPKTCRGMPATFSVEYSAE